MSTRVVVEVGVLPVIAYVGAVLPKRSETFVYREVLGLRKRGHAIVPVSLRAPAADETHDDVALRALAGEAVVVYARGFVRRAIGEAFRHPVGAARATWRLFTAALTSRDLGFPGWCKLPAQCAAGLSLAAELRKRNVGHLHAHMAHAPTTLAMVAADALGVPWSFTGHAADLFRDRAMLKAKLRRAGFVACISAWHRGWYAGVESGVAADGERFPVIRCGVDLNDFSPPEEGSAGDGEAGRPVVLAVGRMVKKKGFDVLLEAWAQILGPISGENPALDGSMADNKARTGQGLPEWGSIGAGEPPMLVMMGDGPELEPLQRRCAVLGIEDHVRFPGAASQAEVRSAMRGCTVFALPCRPAADGDRDGIPVVLMEAMACGKPVIGGDLEAIRELLSDNSGGWVVPPGDVDMLDRAMRKLLSSPEERADRGRRGRARVEEEFSASVNLDRLERAFAGVAVRGNGHVES